MRLRVIYSRPMDGRLNVALDSLAVRRTTPEGPVVLRFIRCSEPTISVGMDLGAPEVTAAAILHPEAHVVRRPTGGGVLLHDDQMSFSLIWPHGPIQALMSARQSYDRIQGAFSRALAECGVEGVKVYRGREDLSTMCSASIRRGDLITASGGKLLGGAVCRPDGASVYQGHLWMRWVPAVEESAALRIGELLGMLPEPEPLTDEEIEDAGKDTVQGSPDV